MTGLILLEILLWNLFKKTTLIADEYSAYGLAVLIFLGCGYTLKEKGHIRIELILNLLPERLAWFLKIIAGLVSTVLLGYITWQLGRMTFSDAVVDAAGTDCDRSGNVYVADGG